LANWEPSGVDLADALIQQNPWMATELVPDALAPPTERPLVAGITAALLRDDFRRFQVILGPRRVGKTTVMYQTVRHLLAAGVPARRIWWLRLDHPLFLDLPLGTLVSAALQVAGGEEDVYLFLDELVYAKDWMLWLKTFFDERWPVRIVGSSSAVGALRRQHPEAGVGRWEERYLTPYLLTEYLDLRGHRIDVVGAGSLDETMTRVISSHLESPVLAEAYRELLLTGGFPELLARFLDRPASDTERLLESQRVLRADVVERAIYKDIPQSFGVDSPMQLERLLYVAAGQMTGLLSPRKMAGQLGLAEPTVENYLSYLERSYVLFTLSNYSGSEISRQRRGRKLYFYDGAVRNAALERGLGPLQNLVEMGQLYENMAASHLYCLSLLTGVRCFHWRDGDLEVDLIHDDPEKPMAFEIATSPTHSRRGLRALVDRHPRFSNRLWVISSGGPSVLPEHDREGIGQLPLELFLVAVGVEFNERLSRLFSHLDLDSPGS
jgi:predicted AAA+ superfamily ATPase